MSVNLYHTARRTLPPGAVRTRNFAFVAPCMYCVYEYFCNSIHLPNKRPEPVSHSFMNTRCLCNQYVCLGSFYFRLLRQRLCILNSRWCSLYPCSWLLQVGRGYPRAAVLEILLESGLLLKRSLFHVKPWGNMKCFPVSVFVNRSWLSTAFVELWS
jgi:hypothetical protein